MDRKFPYPKSLYAVADALRVVVQKQDALILDFFAGSGTTLHAVNLLNAEDGGRRRCILVTNNEVSDEETKGLRKQGFQPGDDEWEKVGIARYVTWPRTVCSIKGIDIKGNPIVGDYFGSDRPMSEGFESNAIFFKLGFLDKTSISLGKQLKDLFPVLWMKAGAIGECPTLASDNLDMVILPQNKFAVLINESRFAEFERELNKHGEINTIYIITDSEAGYREMISSFNNVSTYQLYRDYLDNFRIVVGR